MDVRGSCAVTGDRGKVVDGAAGVPRPTPLPVGSWASGSVGVWVVLKATAPATIDVMIPTVASVLPSRPGSRLMSLRATRPITVPATAIPSA